MKSGQRSAIAPNVRPEVTCGQGAQCSQNGVRGLVIPNIKGRKASNSKITMEKSGG